MMIIEIAAYGLIGIVAGVMAGLLGVSGGIITVPCLLLIFKLLAFPQAYIMHLALGTSLAAMVFNSISSTISHNRKQGVLWSVVKKMAPGIVLGSIFGAMIADFLSAVILERIFGVFAILAGLNFLRKQKLHEGEHRLPGMLGQSSVSFCVAAISNILGIGGGVLVVPVLTAFKVSIKKAIGTSAATGFLISLLGALSYLYFGLNEDTSVKYAAGFLYLPAFIVISICTYFAAPFGVKLVHEISTTLLRRIFAIAMLLIGFTMIIF